MDESLSSMPPIMAPPGRPRVLVVDDDPLSSRLLEKTLCNAGFDATAIQDGQLALESIAREKPDLLLLDFKMPGLSGLEVCATLRKHEDPAIREIPVIMLTGHSTEPDEVSCWNAGANDFVSKPVSRSALILRINTQLRLHALGSELRLQNEELSRWHQEREADLEAARSTQQVILPTDLPEMPGWKIETLYSPVIQVGGDIYGWRPGPDGSWLVWLADATGHGASAALFTTLAAFLFNGSGLNTASPGALLERVNARFYSVFEGHSIMSACCLLVYPDGRALFANAGHPPLLIRRINGSVEAVTERQTMIGIHPHLDFVDAETRVERGETAVLLTDGLYSLVGQNGERMEEHAAREALASIPDGPVIDPLVAALKAVSKDGVFMDDVAVIALRRG